MVVPKITKSHLILQKTFGSPSSKKWLKLKVGLEGRVGKMCAWNGDDDDGPGEKNGWGVNLEALE